jgi:RimJ/RimL family protein N-acetyltransferase
MPADDVWLTTARLALRRFTADDLPWLETLYADEAVTRHLGGPKDRAGVNEMMTTRILRYYDEHPGLGVWATIERATGRQAGVFNLNHIQGESIIQVGFVLDRPAWGRGFATEMAVALLRYGFADLGLPHIAGMADPQNVASHHVLQKIGLHRNGERAFPHPSYATAGPMAWFEREAADWLAERAGSRPRGRR